MTDDSLIRLRELIGKQREPDPNLGPRRTDPNRVLPGVGEDRPQDALRVLLGPDGIMPTRAHHDDAGFDLYASADTWLQRGAHTDVPCDIRMALPWDCWGLIIGRSSTLRRRGIHVNINVIDPGYRGPMFIGCWLPNEDEHGNEGALLVRRGERLAQLVLMPNLALSRRLTEVNQLDTTTRGEDGFGSSGN